MVAPVQPAPDPTPEPTPVPPASKASRTARTLISAPFKIDVERQYVAACGTCQVADPAGDVGSTLAKELYAGTDRDEAIRLAKEHADAHREHAARLAATPLPDDGPSEGE